MADTLKSICAQCTHLNNPQLEFVSDRQRRLRDILLRDLNELAGAAASELEKVVVILCGVILEAILYGFIEGQSHYIAARRGEFEFDPERGLEDYKNIFNRWFRDSMPNARLPDSVVGYRDLVHVNRELNSPSDVCGRAAREMLRLLDALLEELSAFTAPQAGSLPRV